MAELTKATATVLGSWWGLSTPDVLEAMERKCFPVLHDVVLDVHDQTALWRVPF